MKKRRIVIISFVLAAVLTVGVGFAALAETLNISGTGTFRPVSVVNDRVDAAISFTNATADNIYCTAASASGDMADMTVLINDAGERTEFEAVAIYEVTYSAANAGASTYPAVEISVEKELTQALGSSASIAGFAIDVTYNYEDNAKVANKLSPGEKMTVTVKVTYNKANDPTLTEISTASIAVALHYSTEDAVSQPIEP